MRANISGGPLAKGLSILLFSRGPHGSCKIKSAHRMPSHTFEQLLERACKLCGVDPGFWDIWGRYHETTLEAQQAILAAKGFDARDEESLTTSLMEHARRDWDALLPPSIVTEESNTL